MIYFRITNRLIQLHLKATKVYRLNTCFYRFSHKIILKEFKIENISDFLNEEKNAILKPLMDLNNISDLMIQQTVCEVDRLSFFYEVGF